MTSGRVWMIQTSLASHPLHSRATDNPIQQPTSQHTWSTKSLVYAGEPLQTNHLPLNQGQKYYNVVYELIVY